MSLQTSSFHVSATETTELSTWPNIEADVKAITEKIHSQIGHLRTLHPILEGHAKDDLENLDLDFAHLVSEFHHHVSTDQHGLLLKSRIIKPAVDHLISNVAASVIPPSVSEEILKDLKDFKSMDLTEKVTALLKAVKIAFEFKAKKVIIRLAGILKKIAVHLHPLPSYKKSPEIMDGHLGPIKYIDMVMDNWGKTLHSKNVRRIYYPETRAGVQAVVKKAATEGLRVRASGMRHTWNPWMWGVDNELDEMPPKGEVDIFLAMVPNEVSDNLSHARGTTAKWRNRAHELTQVTGPLKIWTDSNGKRQASVKVGGAALNEQLFQWIMENKEWTLPMNTIMLLMTIGGTTSVMCHGGGIQHKSISDQILAIEYVDANGDIQVVDDPVDIKAAAGAFGLLGIIISITFKMDEMTHARWGPRKLLGPLENYFSRPGTELTDEAIKLYRDHYYSEWIAFPRHHMHNKHGLLWQNVWKNDGKKEESKVLIDQLEDAFQISYQFLGEVAHQIYKVVLEAFNAREFAHWLYGWMIGSSAKSAMIDLPEPITTTTTEALHFQQGLHTLIEKGMEMNIPIPDDGTGHPDWTIIQKAWWAGQDLLKSYEDRDLYPVDFAMEMRLMSGSDVLMAPYFGNKHGTVSIEIISSTLIPNSVWEDFKSDLATVWSKLTDKHGNILKARPHWAKEFPQRVGDQTIDDYMKDVYADQIPNFIAQLKKIVAKNGGDFEKSKKRFSTHFLDEFFAGHW